MLINICQVKWKPNEIGDTKFSWMYKIASVNMLNVSKKYVDLQSVYLP